MFETLKDTGRQIGRQFNRAWDSVSEGWNELLGRSGSALTHFASAQSRDSAGDAAPDRFPSWSLLAGELEETERDVVVRLELPGMDRTNCQIEIDGNLLRVSGEKHAERESSDSVYHIMERAYGSFERTIVLPRNVDSKHALAEFRHGVLTIRLPKRGGEKVTQIPVT